MRATGRYRLYVDESGDHTYDQTDIAGRYLSLTGVAIASEYYRRTFHPGFEQLKQTHFPHDPDQPVVLVRRKIIDRKDGFWVLRDAARNAAWEGAFLDFVWRSAMKVFT